MVGRKEEFCFGHLFCFEFGVAVTAQVGTPVVGYRSAEFSVETGLEKAIWDTTA